MRVSTSNPVPVRPDRRGFVNSFAQDTHPVYTGTGLVPGSCLLFTWLWRLCAGWRGSVPNESHYCTARPAVFWAANRIYLSQGRHWTPRERKRADRADPNSYWHLRNSWFFVISVILASIKITFNSATLKTLQTCKTLLGKVNVLIIFSLRWSIIIWVLNTV